MTWWHLGFKPTFLGLILGIGWLSTLQVAGQSTSELPIKVTKERKTDSNIYGWGQDVEIAGQVMGDVGCLSGNAFISGFIKGNLNVVNGNVHLSSTAEVRGNIVCLGGSVTTDPGATVNGRTLNYFKGQDAAASLSSMKAKIAGFFAKCFLLLLLVVLLFYMFPNQISEASFQLSQHATRAFFIGFSTMTALVFFIFISLLLMVVVIGLPLLILLLAVYIAMAAFGLVIVFFRLAFSLRHWTHERMSLITALFLVTLTLALLFQIPGVRVLLAFVLLIFGTGIVIETRFGTNKHWFTRKERIWAAN